MLKSGLFESAEQILSKYKHNNKAVTGMTKFEKSSMLAAQLPPKKQYKYSTKISNLIALKSPHFMAFS